MAYGLLDGRPFSATTICTYMYYAKTFLQEYGFLTETTLKRVLMSVPPTMFAKREKIHRALVCFGKFLVEDGLMLETDWERLKKFRPKRHIQPTRSALTETELNNLIAVCKSPLDTLIVVLLASTGLRVTEACALCMRDIDLQNGVLTVRHGKGGKNRRVGLPAIAIEAIQQFLKVSPRSQPDDLLFLNLKGAIMDRHGIKQRLERISKQAGLQVSPHTLRRTFVTINANKGRPLAMLQIACGHSDITTTRSYCLTSEDEVIAAMQDW